MRGKSGAGVELSVFAHGNACLALEVLPQGGGRFPAGEVCDGVKPDVFVPEKRKHHLESGIEYRIAD